MLLLPEQFYFGLRLLLCGLVDPDQEVLDVLMRTERLVLPSLTLDDSGLSGERRLRVHSWVRCSPPVSGAHCSC